MIVQMNSCNVLIYNGYFSNGDTIWVKVGGSMSAASTYWPLRGSWGRSISRGVVGVGVRVRRGFWAASCHFVARFVARRHIVPYQTGLWSGSGPVSVVGFGLGKKGPTALYNEIRWGVGGSV